MISPSCFVLVEAKRIRRSSFGPQQLAREYVALMRATCERTPVFLVLLGSAPPVAVQGCGRLDPKKAVLKDLRAVLASTEDHDLTYEELADRFSDVFCWISWQEISDLVTSQLATFDGVTIRWLAPYAGFLNQLSIQSPDILERPPLRLCRSRGLT